MSAPAPSSPELIEKAVRSSWIWIGRRRSIPGISTQDSIRGRQRETPTDYCLLGVFDRHLRASARDGSGTTEGSQDTVEKTATANRSSGALARPTVFAGVPEPVTTPPT